MKKLIDVINEYFDEKVKKELEQVISYLEVSPIDYTDNINKMIGAGSAFQYASDLAAFEKKNIDDVAKQLQRIFQDDNKMMTFAKLVRNKIGITAQDFIKNQNSLYDLLHSKGIDLSDNALKEIATMVPSRNSITRGMFEILVSLCLTDIDQNSPSGRSGDIYAGGNVLEFKTPGARLRSQKEHPSTAIAETLYDELLSIPNINININRSDCNIMMSDKNIKDFFSKKVQIPTSAITSTKLFEILFHSLQSQFEDPKTGALNASNYNSLCKSIVRDKNGYYEVDPKNLRKLMGCIQLHYYYEDENYDYMIIFKGKNGKEAVNKGLYVALDGSTTSDIITMFNDNNIQFIAGGRGSKSTSPRDHYCSITYN